MTREEIVKQFKGAKEEASPRKAPKQPINIETATKAAGKPGIDYPMIFDAAEGASVRRDKLNIVAKSVFEKNAAFEQVWQAQAHAMTASSYATEPHGQFVKIYTSNGDGSFDYTETTSYSAKHYEIEVEDIAQGGIEDITNATQQGLDDLDDKRIIELKHLEAALMTADSYASEPHGVEVKEYYYDEATDSYPYNSLTDTYSAAHYAEEARLNGSGFNYIGTWDASSGSWPPDGTEDGDLYIVNVGGTIDGEDFYVGDWIVWHTDTMAWTGIHWNFSWAIARDVTVDGNAPAVGDNLASVDYADTKLSKTGGTITGDLEVNGSLTQGGSEVLDKDALAYTQGLLFKRKLSDGDDLNDIIESGVYLTADSENPNQPCDGTRHNLVVMYVSGYGHQILYKQDTNDVYIRASIDNTPDWSPWTRVMNSAGGTIDGDLVLAGYGTSAGTIRLMAADTSNPVIFAYNSDGSTRGGIQFDRTNGSVLITSYGLDGSYNSTLAVYVDGNAGVTASAPTEPSHLTRKDYVDSLALKMLNKLLDKGLITQVDIDEIIGG